MALSDRVDELRREVATLAERVDNLRISYSRADRAQEVHVRELADLKRDVVLLRREIEALQKWREDHKKDQDERTRRLWAFGPNLVAALLSGVISATVAYFVARR